MLELQSSGAGGRTQDGGVGASFAAAVVVHLRLFTSDIGGAAFGFSRRECCCEWLLCSCHEREQRLPKQPQAEPESLQYDTLSDEIEYDSDQ